MGVTRVFCGMWDVHLLRTGCAGCRVAAEAPPAAVGSTRDLDVGSCHHVGDWEMIYGAVPQRVPMTWD